MTHQLPHRLAVAPRAGRPRRARLEPSVLLTLDQVVTVAEESVRRAGLAGRVWVVPEPSEFPEGIWDAGYHRATASPLELLLAVLSAHDIDTSHIRLVTTDTLARGTSPTAKKASAGLGSVVVPAGNLSALELLHESAHVINSAAAGDGHDAQFVLIAHELYRTYLSPAAAAQFELVTSLHPDVRRMRVDLVG